MSNQQPATHQTGLVVASEVLAGAVAGVLEVGITYPLDFLKTRSQLPPIENNKHSPWRTLVHVYKTENLGSLYKGISALAIGNVAKSFVRFTSYEFTKAQLANEKGRLTVTRTWSAAVISGCLETVLVVAPFENIKTKIVDAHRLNDAGYKRISTATSNMLLADGVIGLYRGTFPLMLRQCSGALSRFWSYSFLKSGLQAELRPGEPIPASMTFLIGAFASASSTYMTMPFDVVKTRMQSISATNQYRHALHCSYRIFTEESIWEFWRGSTPRLMRMMLSGGLSFVFFETTMYFITGTP